MDAAPGGRKLKCPLCGGHADRYCPPCDARITRRDGRVEEARIRGRLAFSRRSNVARELEYPGPQRCELHVTRLVNLNLADTLGGYVPGGATRTKGAAA